MMRVVRRLHPLFVVGLVSAVVLGAHLPARAQSPSSVPGPRIDGQVSGEPVPGRTLDVRADVTMPGGWQDLHVIEVVLLDAGREIERLSYGIESTRLEIGGQDVLTGTGDEGAGAYLRVRGPRVIVTTGGPYLSIQIHADVVRALPQDVRFRLSVTDDMGATVHVTRRLASAEEGRGLGWDIVIAVMMGALLVGAFAGNLAASRRRPPPKLSVYGAVQRRLDAAAREVEPEP